MTRIKHDDTLGGSKRKAQKQPVRRARRSKPCKHERYEVIRIDGSPLTEEWSPWKRECSDCGAQLLIGPSNDEPVAVKIEMRAAELEPIWGLKLMSTLIERSQGEIDGGDCHSMHALGETRGGDYPATLDAGWLAREMATYDDRETRDADAWSWDPTRPIAEQQDEILIARHRAMLAEQTRHDEAAAAARHAELEVITGPEPETGVEVTIETGHTCSDQSLDCSACDVADDEEIGDSTACEACGTSDGCARHRKFTCATCHRLVSWSDGAADDCPDDCSDCWAAKQPSACTPASCWMPCPLRVRSDDPTPVESEIGGQA